MKKMLLLAGLLVSALAYHNPTAAQVSVGVNINIGNQPIWGPTGYDHVDYYYLPDIDAYYYVPGRQFIYYQNNTWVHATSLPPAYRDYDLYRGYKVVINEPKPYLHDNRYKTKYKGYKNWNGRQPVIRDSREEKYFVIKDHPMHGKAKGHDDRGDHGNGNGRGRGHGHN